MGKGIQRVDVLGGGGGEITGEVTWGQCRWNVKFGTAYRTLQQQKITKIINQRRLGPLLTYRTEWVDVPDVRDENLTPEER